MKRKRSIHRGAVSTGTRSHARGRPTAPVTFDGGLITVILTFVVLYATFQALAWLIGYLGYLDPLLVSLARLTGAAANLTGVPATVTGTEISLATRTLRIDPECTALSPMMVFAALVLAYPTGVRSKVAGLLLGIPVLAGTNLLRLVAAAQLSGPLQDQAFLFVHDYLFKIAMAVAVIVVWGVYLGSSTAKRAS